MLASTRAFVARSHWQSFAFARCSRRPFSSTTNEQLRELINEQKRTSEAIKELATEQKSTSESSRELLEEQVKQVSEQRETLQVFIAEQKSASEAISELLKEQTKHVARLPSVIRNENEVLKATLTEQTNGLGRNIRVELGAFLDKKKSHHSEGKHSKDQKSRWWQAWWNTCRDFYKRPLILAALPLLALFVADKVIEQYNLLAIDLNSFWFQHSELPDAKERALCHEAARKDIREALGDTNDALSILVEGPRGSGKTWTVEYQAQQWVREKPLFRRAILVKPEHDSSEESIVAALENAVGYRNNLATQLLQLLYIRAPTRTIDERTDNALSLIEKYASRYDGKVLFVVDDLEEGSKASRCVDRILRRVSKWGTSKVLHPVVISNSSISDVDDSKRRRSYKAHEEQQKTIILGALTTEEARKYLEFKLPLHKDQITDGDINEIADTFGLYVSVLRQISNEAKKDTTGNLVQTALKRIHDQRIAKLVHQLTGDARFFEQGYPREERVLRRRALMRVLELVGSGSSNVSADETCVEDANTFLEKLNYIGTEGEANTPIHREAIDLFLKRKKVVAPLRRNACNVNESE